MKCFKCPDVVCRTEYPEGSVQSVCPRCSWRSSKVKIPIKIPSVQSIPLEITPKSNIFDAIYINNGSSVDSMSQKLQANRQYTDLEMARLRKCECRIPCIVFCNVVIREMLGGN